MRKYSILTVVLLILSSLILFAQSEPTTPSDSGGGIDWFELIILIGYLGGVFFLLPLVIYTNLKEKLFVASPENQEEIQIITILSEEDRNDRAALVLESIEKQMTPFQSEEGDDLVTITSGKQARFTKQGLDYINKNLCPTNTDVIARVNEFSDVYADRARRAFTGSKWIIACSVGVGALFLWTGGITTFIFIHFLGLLFYILSSRTAFYTIEKRMDRFGAGSGLLGSIMTGLFLGDGVKYYMRDSSGFRRRDWETEGQMAIIGLVIMFFVALLLGVFTAFLGVINSVLNYSTSFIIPFKSDDDWFEKNF